MSTSTKKKSSSRENSISSEPVTPTGLCIRRCAWQPPDKDEAPRPKPARHGELCDSCFYRLNHALALIPELTMAMRTQLVPLAASSYRDKITGGRNSSPAPLRIGPLDASDSLYARLVTWTEVVGGKLGHPQPSVAVWMNFREAQGGRPMSPERAHEIASQLVAWFLVRLEQIAGLESIAAVFHDDICYDGWGDSPGVFTLTQRYGPDRPPQKPSAYRDCPTCGPKAVFVKWPDASDPDLAVMCNDCRWVADPATYGFYARLFEDSTA